MEIIFVLARPAYPSNMGGAARALHALGYQELRFVAPERPQTHERALACARSGEELLSRGRVYGSIRDATSDCDLVIGTSAARTGDRQRRSWPLQELVGELERKQTASGRYRVALVLGNERTGMTTEELLCCDLVSHVELHAADAPLNLAQALIVYAYTFNQIPSRKKHLSKVNQRADQGAAGVDTSQGPLEQELSPLRTLVGELLEKLGFAWSDPVQMRLRERLQGLNSGDAALAYKIVRACLRTLVTNAAAKSGNDPR